MIHALVITGQNNHDWRRSAPFCKDLLEATGKFKVDLTENPARTFADASAVKQYQLFFVDYNGPDWGETAKKNFEAAVAAGTGLFVLHAANNIKDWPEFEKMAGLLWREGTGHSAYHEVDVSIVNHDHPVTRGMQDFSLPDELYHRLVNTQNVPYQVLAAAYDNPNIMGTRRRGSGRFEPVMITLEYGRARVFHYMLGHVWPTIESPDSGRLASNFHPEQGASMQTFENAGFQRALVRGCEWAATGDVSDPLTPVDR